VARPEDVNKIYSGSRVAKNTIYNLFGYGIPLIVAVVFIPLLIKGLGDEKFGILNLAWVVIGYFSFFDFGIGRTLTKIVAEKIGLNRIEEIPGMFWTSFFLMLVVSLIGTLLLIFFSPSLVYNFFSISKELQEESINTFYALALSIPIVTTTAGLRGVLEAYQKFGIINSIRVILGVFTFLGPLICLAFTKSLFWIVIFLILIRIVVWMLYLIQCVKVNINIKSQFKFDSELIKPVLKLSGWMTVSNIVGPLITYLDRFLIGALLSVAAITYYATPYEVVTKLFVIPTALVGVLFPAFSATFINQPELSKKLFLKGNKFIFIFLYPIILLIITFAYEGMELWLGGKFAEKSSLVLQLLAVGVLLNSFAFLPFTFLQGIGRPDIPAKINLIELPFYLLAMWFAIKQLGINGAAVVFSLLFFINTLIQFFVVHKIIGTRFKFKLRFLSFLFLAIVLIVPFIITSIFLKIIFASGTLLFFVFIVYRFLVLDEERIFLTSKLEIFRLSFLKINRR
jgi:O-antigen/teichoic acid export membrane protein